MNSLVALAAATAFVSCKESEVYETAVTRDLEMTLDGESWNIYYGTSNRPLYVYKENGDFVGNYSTSYRFAFEEGTYRIFATNQSDYITPPTNLNGQTIEQDPEAKQTFAISDAISYKAGDKMSLALKTRTGMLRLKALDVKADKSYSNLRAVITTPVKAYKVSDASIITGEPTEIVKEKATSGGGVGYTEDIYLIGSADHNVDIRIDYLDSDLNIVRSKPFADGVSILPNQITEVSFELNNPDEPVIVNYTVNLANQTWSDSDIYPAIEIVVPEGYTYVEPGQDLDAAFNEQKNDDSVDEIKLFLKANSSYAFASTTISNCPKAMSIIAQAPGYGQSPTTLTINGMSVAGNLQEIHFENISFSNVARLFNLRNQEFEIGELSFVNCIFDKWNGVIWNQVSNADHQQTVNKVRMEGCRITNYTAGNNALWTLPANRIAPIHNWEFTNCLFHGTRLGTSSVILNRLDKVDGNLSVAIEGCTFIEAAASGTAYTWFTINGAAADNTSVSVKGNIVAGVHPGSGTWFNLGQNTVLDVSGNSRTQGYSMSAYGVDEPAESATTTEELLNQFNL